MLQFNKPIKINTQTKLIVLCGSSVIETAYATHIIEPIQSFFTEHQPTLLINPAYKYIFPSLDNLLFQNIETLLNKNQTPTLLINLSANVTILKKFENKKNITLLNFNPSLTAEIYSPKNKQKNIISAIQKKLVQRQFKWLQKTNKKKYYCHDSIIAVYSFIDWLGIPEKANYDTKKHTKETIQKIAFTPDCFTPKESNSEQKYTKLCSSINKETVHQLKHSHCLVSDNEPLTHIAASMGIPIYTQSKKEFRPWGSSIAFHKSNSPIDEKDIKTFIDTNSDQQIQHPKHLQKEDYLYSAIDENINKNNTHIFNFLKKRNSIDKKSIFNRELKKKITF